jgi:hypothetical protein
LAIDNLSSPPGYGGRYLAKPLHREIMRRIAITLLVAAMLTVIGCGTDKVNTNQSDTPNDLSGGESSSATLAQDDPAQYAFHRKVAFTDVTKDLPDGSVDHIDFNMAADPNVVVVVTVAAPHKDGLHFTTTFTGPSNLRITKDWQPASGGEPKDQHVALFVLPEAVNAGTTVVH